MSTDDLNKLASQNAPIPDGLTQEQQLLYLQLLQLYALNKSGRITREVAVDCKNKLFEEYRKRMSVIKQDELMCTVRKWLGKTVIFRETEYLLTAIICRNNMYQAELTDVKQNKSVVIARMEEVEVK